MLVERPNYLFARLFAAACRVQLADLERAREHVAVIHREHPSFRASAMRQLYEGRIEMVDRLFSALSRAGVPV